MSNSVIQETVNVLLKDINASINDHTILTDFQTKIDSFKTSLSNLGETTSEYIQLYDSYQRDIVKDASILQNELIENVVKVFNDDIE